jgi:pyruvate dehydrogenase (quinone)
MSNLDAKITVERRGQIVLIGTDRTRQELAVPPNTILNQAYHLGMFTMTAVIDGRAKELLDLAQTNLSR